MKRTLVLGLVTLSAAAIAVSLAYGQDRKASAAATPNLTAEQQNRIAEFKATAMAKAAPIRAELQGKLAEIRKLFTVDGPDRKAILAKQDETEPLHRNLREIWTDFALRVHQVLTPAQRTMWADTGWGMGPGMGIGPGMVARPGMRHAHRGGHGPGTGMAVDVGMCPFGCPICPTQP
jgi:Spy/CpxP family protein refolding chaperone